MWPFKERLFLSIKPIKLKLFDLEVNINPDKVELTSKEVDAAKKVYGDFQLFENDVNEIIQKKEIFRKEYANLSTISVRTHDLFSQIVVLEHSNIDNFPASKLKWLKDEISNIDAEIAKVTDSYDRCRKDIKKTREEIFKRINGVFELTHNKKTNFYKFWNNTVEHLSYLERVSNNFFEGNTHFIMEFGDFKKRLDEIIDRRFGDG
jgi:hypothetical protein